MLRKSLAVLFQATLALLFLALPFACLIQSSIDDPWPWIGVMVGLILLSPWAAACGTGSVVSALRSGQPGHKSGMVVGYLMAMIGGSAIHIGLLFFYCSGQVDLDAAIALMACAVVADVALFAFGYRLRARRQAIAISPQQSTRPMLPGSGIGSRRQSRPANRLSTGGSNCSPSRS